MTSAIKQIVDPLARSSPPRVDGGYTSPKKGFDCSGFVSYVLNQMGAKVGHLTTATLRKAGTAVTDGQLQPGDVVVWDNGPDSDDHAQIYVGGGQLAEMGSKVRYVDARKEFARRHNRNYVIRRFFK